MPLPALPGDVAGTSPAMAREAAGNAGFQAPFLGKPLWADGREGSHGLLVIHTSDGLEQLAAGPRPVTPGLPVVLQQFVPHGACLFKVRPLTVLTCNQLLCHPTSIVSSLCLNRENNYHNPEPTVWPLLPSQLRKPRNDRAQHVLTSCLLSISQCIEALQEAWGQQDAPL